MLGFLLKDLYTIKKSLLLAGLFVLVYAVLVCFGGPEILLPIMSVFFTFLCINTFYYDEAVSWESAAAAMPVTVGKIVRSKYLLSAILALAATLIQLLFVGIGFAAGFIHVSFGYLAILLLVGLAGSCCLASILIPFIIRFGSAKSRLVIIIAVALPSGLLGALDKVAQEDSLRASIADVTEWIGSPAGLLTFILFTVLTSVISYLISCGFYRKKEW